MLAPVLIALALAGSDAAPGLPVEGPLARAGAPDGEHVRGITISCQTWGREWGTDAFAADLDRLKALGVNWVAIHPYASIRADGTVSARRFDAAEPPEWLTRPIREAHARELSILVIPHIAYWGSPFAWRGDIAFTEADARARFFATYREWITAVAAATRDADAFCVANELEQLAGFEAEWRSVISAVRGATPARLTWAANWSGYRAVGFWDALDAIGIDAYFPLCERDDPTEAELRAAWKPILADLATFQRGLGKPVVFTELGYRAALDAAHEPWTYREERGAARPKAEAVQERCLRVALEVLEPERAWLRGAFLWKWFAGPTHGGENFVLDRPELHAVIAGSWKRAPLGSSVEHEPRTR